MAAKSPNAVFAVGIRRSATFFTTLAEGWNGSSWRVQRSPSYLGSGDFIAVAADAGSALAVGLYADPSTGLLFVYAATWNGTKWLQTLPISVTTNGSFFLGASAIPGMAGDYWASGSALDQNANYGTPLIESYTCR
jgi:hypothetical protein